MGLMPPRSLQLAGSGGPGPAKTAISGILLTLCSPFKAVTSTVPQAPEQPLVTAATSAPSHSIVSDSKAPSQAADAVTFGAPKHGPRQNKLIHSSNHELCEIGRCGTLSCG